VATFADLSVSTIVNNTNGLTKSNYPYVDTICCHSVDILLLYERDVSKIPDSSANFCGRSDTDSVIFRKI
jgi:hypothetical protein